MDCYAYFPAIGVINSLTHWTGECRKAGKILASFVDPRQAFGPDKIIPPEILAGAKVSIQLLYSGKIRVNASIY